MSARDSLRECTNIAARLLAEGIAIDINPARLIWIEPWTCRVTWAGANDDSIGIPGSEGTIAEYCRLLRQRQFSALLYDGGILQLSATYTRDDLVQYRYVYVPCPIRIGDLLDPDQSGPNSVSSEQPQADITGSGMDNGARLNSSVAVVDKQSAESINFDFHDIIVETLINELQPDRHLTLADIHPGTASAEDPGAAAAKIGPPRLRLRATLRFDYDLRASGPGHPGSHLHFCGEESRWAAFGPLSIGHFIRFVFQHHYPAAWNNLEFIRDWPLSRGPRCITADDAERLFLECHS